MFLHISNFRALPLKDIIGIFNMDIKNNQVNKQFLESFPSERINSERQKKSNAFIITSDKVFYSQVLPLTLQKKAKNISYGKFSGGV
jgi:hypothetical protein